MIGSAARKALLLGYWNRTLRIDTKRRALSGAEPRSWSENTCRQRDLICQLLVSAWSSQFWKLRIDAPPASEAEWESWWHRLPILDKSDIRSGMLLVNDACNNLNWRWETSGGSTGEPVRVAHDNHYLGWRTAHKLNLDSWMGVAPGQRRLLLWGSEADLLGTKQSFKRRFGRILRGERWFNAFSVTDQSAVDFVRAVNAWKPGQILAYAESLTDLSKRIEAMHLEIRHRPSIMVTAGNLLPDMRATLERIWKTEPYNRYGSREVGDMACQRDGAGPLYVCPLIHRLDILPDGESITRSEGEGSIIVTLLTNSVMPLIRYRIGDRGILRAPRPDDRLQWQCLDKVVGRESDIFYAPGGKKVHGEFLTHLLYHKTWVSRFRFTQTDEDHIKLELETRAEPPTEEILTIRKAIQVVFGDGCKLSIIRTPRIPPLPSGKHRYTICTYTPPNAP